MNASVNKTARTAAGWRALFISYLGLGIMKRCLKRDFVISLYFCRSPLSSASGTAPFRIPDFDLRCDCALD